MRRFSSWLISVSFTLVLAGLVATAVLVWWTYQPLKLKLEAPQDSFDLAIEPGTSARAVARMVSRQGIQGDSRVNEALLYAWFRLSGKSRQIKAGSYEIERGTSPKSLLQKLVQGEEAFRAMTIVEGWTFRQVRDSLSKAEHLSQQTRELEASLIMEKLGKPGMAPEGRFFPDTYTYAKGSTDLALLKRAMRAMDRQLDAAWQQHSAESPLKSPEQALTLASIIEKETGRASDRPLIGGVFNNRLKIGMMLQTDPSVIYGLGDQFDGNLRKRDLMTDTPWNTYTRTGLPPTPIAMPGKAALMAAVQPAPTRALYFVARGDGTSQFSESLADHNRAVNKYQRGK